MSLFVLLEVRKWASVMSWFVKGHIVMAAWQVRPSQVLLTPAPCGPIGSPLASLCHPIAANSNLFQLYYLYGSQTLATKCMVKLSTSDLYAFCPSRCASLSCRLLGCDQKYIWCTVFVYIFEILERVSAPQAWALQFASCWLLEVASQTEVPWLTWTNILMLMSKQVWTLKTQRD